MTAEIRFLANNKSPLTVLEALVKHNSLKIEINAFYVLLIIVCMAFYSKY